MMTPEPAEEASAVEKLTLYGMAGDLWPMISLRDELVTNGEPTEAIDEQIQLYFRTLERKVDRVVHVLRTFKAQEKLAEEEEQRLHARAKRFQSWREYLERCAMEVLAQMPAPVKGPRKLEGATSTLTLAGNGGPEPLEISDERLVPDELCAFVVELSGDEYRAIRERFPVMEALARATRYADSKKIRERMKRRCAACGGQQDTRQAGCTFCGGMGLEPVPGARFKERGHHLRVT